MLFMSEEHLDLFSFATGDGLGLGLCDRTGLVASGFMNRARDFASRHVWAALGLERAGLAVVLEREVDHRPTRREARRRLDGISSALCRWGKRKDALLIEAEVAVPLEAEAVKQRLLHHAPLSHHRPNLLLQREKNQRML
jgi:hypothetical protein